MPERGIGRRAFMQACAATTASLAVNVTSAQRAQAVKASKPALLGGEPVRAKPFPGWPQMDARYEKKWIEVLREQAWSRHKNGNVEQFEAKYGETIGVKHCLATANGTGALLASLLL